MASCGSRGPKHQTPGGPSYRVRPTTGKLGDKEFVVVSARGGGYGPGTPREGWDHREPWLRHALTTLGVQDAIFIDTELTLARESPAMIPLDLGAAEDRSLADAFAAIDGLLGTDKLLVTWGVASAGLESEVRFSAIHSDQLTGDAPEAAADPDGTHFSRVDASDHGGLGNPFDRHRVGAQAE
jgi:hypothetical protein